MLLVRPVVPLTITPWPGVLSRSRSPSPPARTSPTTCHWPCGARQASKSEPVSVVFSGSAARQGESAKDESKTVPATINGKRIIAAHLSFYEQRRGSVMQARRILAYPASGLMAKRAAPSLVARSTLAVRCPCRAGSHVFWCRGRECRVSKYPLRSFAVPEARLFRKAGLLFAGKLLSGYLHPAYGVVASSAESDSRPRLAAVAGRVRKQFSDGKPRIGCYLRTHFQVTFGPDFVGEASGIARAGRRLPGAPSRSGRGGRRRLFRPECTQCSATGPQF